MTFEAWAVEYPAGGFAAGLSGRMPVQLFPASGESDAWMYARGSRVRDATHVRVRVTVEVIE